jgi:hypothetical protein
MFRPVVIRRHPDGLRVWIGEQRVHHGATGCVLAAFAVKRPLLGLVAAALILHDRADWRVWFSLDRLTRKP